MAHQLQRFPRSTPALTLILLLAWLFLPAPSVRAEPAVAIPRTGGGCGPGNVEGWQFQTAAALTVSALGVYDYDVDGLDHDIPVGLYDASCTLVTSVLVPQALVAPLLGEYRYVPIPPIVLPAGQTFRLGALISCGDYSPSIASLDGVVLASGIGSVVGTRKGNTTMLACPNQASSGFGFAPNFIIGPPCGNGILQEGEQCDDGNVDDGDCCSAACLPQNAGAPCPPDDLICTADRCTAAGACEHVPGNAGTACREPAYACDATELCDGDSADCPEDENLPDQAPCPDDMFCNGSESCFEGTCGNGGEPCQDATCDEDADTCVPWTPTVTAVPTAPPTAIDTLTPSPMATEPSPPTSPPTATTTGSPPRTPVPSETPTAPSTPAATCRGDCDGDRAVAINELVIAVTIALGGQPLATCPSLDSSTDGTVEINELIVAVANALDGCA